ncbi:mannitol dehydrogenase family protein [Pseudolysobacter antarcticus]|uniref:Mannitol dehydrogenase family protein n=1 Tax=Pseudolysobacter antarcticus TaxID=2511995 RepID=A0A411HG36_9GAMM|nr:mannitol dehydrogenase family protein [Pseudolysobacter antarcticus]QBB69407.1 mannitol dehydrogenase family protein [Pseudolysobacter antarcticus]
MSNDPVAQHDEDSSAHLDVNALKQLPADIQRPRYPLDTIDIGVAHLGPGAFHRAHQAWFFDDALNHDTRWGVSAISLKTASLRDALAPQNGLYTVAVLDATIRDRVIGALRETLVASEDRQRALARLSAAQTRIVTLTITEKGYCLDADGQLDFSHPDIRADLAAPHAPSSSIGYLVAALRQRRERGIKPFSVISCDNLSDNGGKLGRAVVALAGARDSDLARWIEAEVAFPRSMVDSIVPATDAALRERVAAALGVEDRWPVQREAFAQWVIEDRFCNDVPDWTAIGVNITRDVAAFERAKLRLLNGAHSTLAYLGLLAGHETVLQAMDDTALAIFVENLMREDISPTVSVPADFDLDGYIGSVLARFRNRAMSHALAQIAWDGSQKLPFRLLATIRDALIENRSIKRLCVPIAAWLHFIRRALAAQRVLVDPLAEMLNAAARRCDGSGTHDVVEFLDIGKIFGEDLPRDPRFVAALVRAYDRLATLSIDEALRR